MNRVARRTFITGSVPALAAAALPSSRVLGANDRIGVAVVGVRGRGRALAAEFAGRSDVRIAALADVDGSVIGPALEAVKARQPAAPRVEQDFRKLLEDRSIDAMVFALPAHWFALATIWSCQAGKDVYVEKPVCHNIVEGQRMVEAARKHRRVVQVGTQRRSSPAVLEAAAYVRSGKLGRVALARAWHFYKRPSIGHVADEAVPAGVDYDLWLGPAPKRPFNRNRFHYNWHWNWDYGTGELGNNGVHGLDMVRILLGLGSPGRVSSTGGIFVHRDDRTTPDTQTVTFEYPNVTVVWEHLQGSAYGLEGPIGEAVNKAGTAHLSFGAVLYGTEGTLVSHVAGWEVHHGTQVTRHAGTNGQTEHVGNFLDCMRSRAKPNADIETGYGSATLCHLGNIAYRVGRTVKLDPVRRRFAGDAEADALLGRTYRAPFVLPEKV